MGELVVVTGPPGAGKSTVCELLAARYDPSALVAGDAFFGFLRTGAIEPWSAQAHQQNTVVTEAAAGAAGRLSSHCTVIYDGVVGPWFLPTFARQLNHERLHYVVLLPPLQVCLSRVANRTGHGFTDLTAAGQLHQDFSAAELDSRHLLTDATADPLSLAGQIGRGVADGSLRYRPA